MPTTSYTAWATVNRKNSEVPAATAENVVASGVILYPIVGNETAEEAEARLRISTGTVDFTPSEVTNLVIVSGTGTDNTGGGGNTTPSGLTAVVPLMQQIRGRYRSAQGLVDVGITGSGDWKYKVARTAVNSDYVQLPPDWDTIAWVDWPGGSGERTISTAHHVNKAVQILIQSKSNSYESYEVPVYCIGGGTGGFDWLIYSLPQSGIIDATKFTIMPGRTWHEDWIITPEPGPTAETINVRCVSGYSRPSNANWYYYFNGVPLKGRANQDNFVVTCQKQEMFDFARYEIYKNYTTRYGENLTGRQLTAGLITYESVTPNSVDSVKFWTGN